MGLDLLPAVIEILRLLGIVGIAVGAIILAVRLNYRFYASPLYLPTMVALGLFLGFELKVAMHADNSVVGFFGLMPVLVGLFFKRVLRGKYQSPILFAAPAVVAVFLLFMYPLIFELYLAFHRLNLETLGDWIRTGQITFVGFDNFWNVLSVGSATKESFWLITGRTFLWTFINLFFHVTVGLGLALLLNTRIRGIGVYRTILILPWALPQLIAVLAWRGEFHSTYGYVNAILDTVNQVFRLPWGDTWVSPLALIGLESKQWWTDPQSLFASICIVNVWLGIPFMMIVSLSALQSIPRSYYEAASIDGASPLQQFKSITLPLIQPVMVPSMVLGMIWTFNNVNVVYLMTAQRGGSEGADILVSDLYKQAFVFNRYSFSAAYAVVIFFILLALTVFWLKVSRIADDPAR